jgi:hypothetical protein
LSKILHSSSPFIRQEFFCPPFHSHDPIMSPTKKGN